MLASLTSGSRRIKFIAVFPAVASLFASDEAYPKCFFASIDSLEHRFPSGMNIGSAVGDFVVNNAEWHWSGRGGVTTVPPGSPIRLNLEQGEFVFRIYPR